MSVYSCEIHSTGSLSGRPFSMGSPPLFGIVPLALRLLLIGTFYPDFVLLWPTISSLCLCVIWKKVHYLCYLEPHSAGEGTRPPRLSSSEILVKKRKRQNKGKKG